MAVSIFLKSGNYKYDKETKTFTMSEKDVKFATEYLLKNGESGGQKEFYFTHSTGPEFDPNTKWIYKDKNNEYTLEICNDPVMTKKSSDNYLRAKIG